MKYCSLILPLLLSAGIAAAQIPVEKAWSMKPVPTELF